MACDSINNIGKQERIKIESKNFAEIEQIKQLFPQLNSPEISEAIKTAGPFRNDVIKYIKGLKNFRSSL